MLRKDETVHEVSTQPVNTVRQLALTERSKAWRCENRHWATCPFSKWKRPGRALKPAWIPTRRWRRKVTEAQRGREGIYPLAIRGWLERGRGRRGLLHVSEKALSHAGRRHACSFIGSSVVNTHEHSATREKWMLRHTRKNMEVPTDNHGPADNHGLERGASRGHTPRA